MPRPLRAQGLGRRGVCRAAVALRAIDSIELGVGPATYGAAWLEHVTLELAA